jgi:TRAP-type mannitol/chloroaromatic compound transport system substrate-binding protein
MTGRESANTRRRVLKGLAAAAGAGALAGVAPAARAQQPIKWKMMSLWPAGSVPQKLFEAFAQQVKAMSGGRLTIEAMPGGTVVAATESLDAVTAGVLDGQNGGPAYNTGKDAAFALIGDLQGGWETPLQAQQWLEYGGGKELCRDLYKKYGGYFVTGVWYGNESLVLKKPARGVKDFKGMKLRVPQGMGQEIFKLMGTAPVNLPGSEVYTALERGVVDGTDWGTLAMNQELGYHKLAKYPLYPGVHSMPMSDLVVNLKKWTALPDDLKAIVEAAARDFCRQMIEKNGYDDVQVAMKAKQLGFELIDWSADERRKFREIAQGVWKTYAARSAMAKRAYDSQLAFLQQLGLLK